jgi:hypothetical protein
MRRPSSFWLAVAAAALAPVIVSAHAQETTRAAENGGIAVPGWQGQTDRGAITADRLAKEGDALHVTTGPAVAFWNPSNTATGDYTVKATFREPKFMNLNDHPHPYGIFIGGNDMGTPSRTYFYCAAYGSGSFIARGFGPTAFQLNGREGEENAAVHKAAGKDQPVTQDIAVSVHGDKVSCIINGTAVATYDKSQVVGEGKAKSTDGIYGIRFAHNTDGYVTNLTVTHP